MWTLFYKFDPFFQSMTNISKCDLPKCDPLFLSLNYFSKCDPFFQVWHNFPSVTPDVFVWLIFQSMTFLSKCDPCLRLQWTDCNEFSVQNYNKLHRTIKSFFVVQQNDSANPRYFCLISMYLRMGLRNFSFSCISLIHKLMKAEPTKTHPLNVIVLIILLLQ